MTADAYRQALHRWAAQHVPEGATVTKVDLSYYPGIVWSTETIENPDLTVAIFYRPVGGGDQENADLYEDGDAVRVLSDVGQLLTEMFAIEDTE